MSDPSITVAAREARVRRRAARVGEQVWKPRRPYVEAPRPYTIRDPSRNRIVASGLTLAEVEQRYAD